MNNLFGVVRYGLKIPNLSKVNSVSIQDRVIWITKKNENGKDTSTYIAYDYLTKIKLGVHVGGKKALIEFLEKQDFTQIEGVA